MLYNKGFKPICGVMFALVAMLSMQRSWATDTNAVVATGNAGGSVINGGVGFSFVPTTNLNVTQVGYFDGGTFSNVIISIWLSTNTVLTNFDLGPSSNTQTAVYTGVSNLNLIGGVPYSITVQNGALTNTNAISALVYLPGSNTQVTLAPTITNFQAVVVSPSGVFSSFATNVYLFGVNFAYGPTNLPPPPTLDIAITGPDTVTVSWPSPSTGYFLYDTTNLAPTAWSAFVGTTNDNGTIKSVVISPALGDEFFQLEYLGP